MRRGVEVVSVGGGKCGLMVRASNNFRLASSGACLRNVGNRVASTQDKAVLRGPNTEIVDVVQALERAHGAVFAHFKRRARGSHTVEVSQQ